jgi:hypothetical protein
VSCLLLENYCLGNCSYTRGLFILPVLKTLYSFTSITCQFLELIVFYFLLGNVVTEGNENRTVLEDIIAASCLGVTKFEFH